MTPSRSPSSQGAAVSNRRQLFRKRPTKRLHLPLLAILALPAFAEEHWPVPHWETIPPEERRFTDQDIAPVLRFAEEQNTRILLIVQGGRLELEHSFDDGMLDQSHPLASAAKSVTSLLVGIALADDLLPSVEAPLSIWFPEAKIGGATLADLLTMRSGLPYGRKLQVGMHRAPDWLAYIQAQKPIRAPGTQFLYSGFDPILISAILARATDQPLDVYAKEKLFTPLGITNTTWEGDGKGLKNGGSQLSLTARDFARLGLLCLRNGRWQDRQIVPAPWIEQSTVNQVGGAPWYGYYWWKLPAETEASDPRFTGCYFASGAGGQHLVVLPELDTVLVRLGENPKLTPSGQKFVPELLRKFLITLP